jgi:flagellar basal-body rod protein FlgC
MDYRNVFAISAAGMDLERQRVDVATLNLANANTVQAPGAAPYQPLRVVARPAAFADFLDEGVGAGAGAPPEVSVESALVQPRLVHEPGHPLADARGFVSYAGVDAATEMVTLMGAMRAYEANVAAMNTARALALKSLEIGRAS